MKRTFRCAYQSEDGNYAVLEATSVFSGNDTDKPVVVALGIPFASHLVPGEEYEISVTRPSNGKKQAEEEWFYYFDDLTMESDDEYGAM